MRLITKSKIEQLRRQLSEAQKIAIISHYNPDGDAVGSSLALYQYFKNEGYQVRVILPNPFPQFLAWMPGSEDIIIADAHFKEAAKTLKEADLLFVVDMNAAHRSGKALEQPIIDSPAFKVLIDHHVCPSFDYKVQFSTPDTTSSCELVYLVLDKLSDDKAKIKKEVAECIYVGMITDTGSLSYACNHPITYQILSKLMKLGVDGETIHRNVYDNYEESRIKLLGLCLSQRLSLMREFSTSYMYLTMKDLNDNQYKIGDTEGFVNYGLSMKDVLFTAFFIERENKIRISFRSKGNFDVNLFARNHFNGGGHKNASAAFYYDTLENTIQYFKEVLKQYEKQLQLK
ncbi:MAG TPA: DHH family phosphoesterase [Bacteroidales bacterium]|nr:DHH family phosphoesterase [Bacteroidales bacterium]